MLLFEQFGGLVRFQVDQLDEPVLAYGKHAVSSWPSHELDSWHAGKTPTFRDPIDGHACRVKCAIKDMVEGNVS